jgi:uncharacterized repeat protein (TIGR01451 family)
MANTIFMGDESILCMPALRYMRRRATSHARRLVLASLLLAGGQLTLPRIAAAASTGEHSPIAEVAGSQGGFVNAANAQICDGTVANANKNGQSEIYSTFGLSLPGNAVIQGIQVRVRANDGSANNRSLQVSLSSDGGGTFTAPIKTLNFHRGTPLRDYFVGGSNVLWGRTWSPTDFSDAHFGVKLNARKGNNNDPVNLDCLPVTVFYSIPGTPDLNIDKIVSPDPVLPLQNLTYTIHYSNTGSATATNVIVSDTTPANTTFVSASPAPISAPSVGGQGTVTWNVGSVAAGGSGTVTLVVQVAANAANGTQIVNGTYSAASDQTAPTPGDPVSATVESTIVLSLTKSNNPQTLVVPGTSLSYTLAIHNGGSGQSTNIIVDDPYDGNVTFVSQSSVDNHGNVCATFSTPPDEWTISTLNAGDTCTISIATTVNSPLSDGVLITNTASLIDDNNNTATSSVVNTVNNPAVCGDGVVKAPEQCDQGGANGTPGSCCSATCMFAPSNTVCRAANGVCDVAENCTGSSVTCPADQFATSGVCRAANGVCDVAESCDGSGPNCPADHFATSGVCRPANGVCDVAESCDGSGPNCPADHFATSGVCRPTNGVCDMAESCDGSGPNCPADHFATSGVCRPANGVCDVAESCDGSGPGCPPDNYAPSSTVCRPAAGVCDVTENCPGNGPNCPADAFLSSSTVCRPAVGVCDVAETCPGTGPTCPADALKAAGTVCRPGSGDACDPDEACDGNGADCPPDVFEPASAVCRPGSGDSCDPPEFCPGVAGGTCAADIVEPSGTTCRPATDVCDLAESCSGVAGQPCPSDGKESSGTACPSDGNPCTLDQCDGTNDACQHPAGNAGAVCRPSAGACDIAESCDGVSSACPADGFQSNNTVCRPAAGVCDIAENCPGNGPNCPADGKSTAVCRPIAGTCDVAESCDGVNNACPLDGFKSSSNVCRPAAGQCDLAENCTGAAAACPADVFEPNGTSCTDDGTFCDGVETCQNGLCQSAGSACPAGDSCDEASKTCFQGQCPATPATCRTAQKMLLSISEKADSTKNKLKWKWLKGAATTQADFADPVTTAEYALCFYSGPTASLVDQVDVSHANLWSAISTKGFKYKDPSLSQDGVQRIVLKGGSQNKSKALMKAKGARLPALGLPIMAGDLPLIVQLRNNQTGICWGSSFSSTIKNVPGQFKATVP